LIRDVMYCKPGKVREMVAKYKDMNKLGAKHGMPKLRVLTDLSAERYWTLVSEMEVPSLDRGVTPRRGDASPTRGEASPRSSSLTASGS
jgi:hypothetical protein